MHWQRCVIGFLAILLITTCPVEMQPSLAETSRYTLMGKEASLTAEASPLFANSYVAESGEPEEYDGLSGDNTWKDTRKLQSHYFNYCYYEAKTSKASNTVDVLISAHDRYLVNEAVAEHQAEIKMIAKVIYRESRGESITIRAGIAWTILNRYDAEVKPTISKVITHPYQFAYRKRTPIIQEHLDIATDVYVRWYLEKLGYTDVGRVLPKEYQWYAARNRHTRFRDAYEVTKETNYWEWDLPIPEWYLE